MIDIQAISAYSAIALPLVTGLVEMAKRVFKMSDRIVPLAALAFGLVVSFLVLDLTIVQNIIGGLVMGLGAIGLWEFAKKATNK